MVSLDRALYGCIESDKLWYGHIASTLTNDMGFVKNQCDICVINKLCNEAQVIICVYVDDLLITSANSNALEDTITRLTVKYRVVKCHRYDTHSYLGMTIHYTTNSIVKFMMEGMIEDVLREYEVVGMATSPASVNLFQINESSPPLNIARKFEFHSRVAKLAYMSRKV